MLIEICPTSVQLEIAPFPVSISATKQEFRVLESSNIYALRESTKIILTYILDSAEMESFLQAMNLSYGALVSWELGATMQSYISLDPSLYQFEPFWRYQNEKLEISVDETGGVFKFQIYIVNVRS